MRIDSFVLPCCLFVLACSDGGSHPTEPEAGPPGLPGLYRGSASVPATDSGRECVDEFFRTALLEPVEAEVQFRTTAGGREEIEIHLEFFDPPEPGVGPSSCLYTADLRIAGDFSGYSFLGCSHFDVSTGPAGDPFAQRICPEGFDVVPQGGPISGSVSAAGLEATAAVVFRLFPEDGSPFSFVTVTRDLSLTLASGGQGEDE